MIAREEIGDRTTENMTYRKVTEEEGKYSLTKLETRRLRGVPIEICQTINSYENIDRNFLSANEEGKTRRHEDTLAKKQCILDITNKH